MILRLTVEPAQVGIKTVVEGVGMVSEGFVIEEGELHPAHYGVEALGFGIYEAPDQPNADCPVYVATTAGCPAH